MPHTFALVKRGAQMRVNRALGNNYVEDVLSESVAQVFNQIAGEDLQAGENSKAYHPQVTTSQPADLIVVVIAWWTAQRAPHFEAIRQRLAEVLAHWAGDRFTVEVHLNIIGRRELDQSLYADEAQKKDSPFCMQCGVQMQKAGSGFACPSCGTTSGFD